MNENTKATLAKVSGLLAQIVGQQKMVLMTPEEFVAHAVSEVTKAQSESLEKSHARLDALQKSVLFSSANIEDTQADNIKVPVFVADQTTLSEQTNTVTSPLAAAGKNPADGTVFEDGFLAKRLGEALKTIADLGKAMEEEETEDEEKKKAAEEEEEKKKAAKAQWPEDMNEPSFVKDGVTKRDLDWGEDRTR